MALIEQTRIGMEIMDVGAVEFPTPEMEKKGFPKVFQVRQRKELTDNQKTAVEKLVSDVLTKNGDDVFVSGFGDKTLQFAKIDEPEGMCAFKIHLECTNWTEGLVVGNEKRFQIFTEFFHDLQKKTNNAYIVMHPNDSYKGNVCFGIDKKGVFPTVTFNNCLNEKRRKHISVADFLNDNKKAIDEKIKEAEGDMEPNPHPWVFAPFEHPDYTRLCDEHAEKLAEKEAAEAAEAAKAGASS